MPDLLSPVIKLDGQVLDAKWWEAISELRVERQFQVPGRVTVRFNDPGYVLTSAGSLKLAGQISISDSAGSDYINAEIVSVAVEQLPGDQPELVAVALDRSHRLGRGSQINVYSAMSYSDIVSKVLGQDPGITPSVDSISEQLPYLLQTDSDLGLITELARRVGYDWWVGVDGKTFNFKKPSSKAPQATLQLSVDLKSFSVRAAGVRPEKVEVQGWDKEKLDGLSGEASSPSVPVAESDLADLIGSKTKAFGSDAVVIGSLGATSTGEAKTLAQAIYDRASTAAVTAKGVLAGASAAFDLGDVVQIDGAGPLNGKYPVTEIEHLYRPRSGFLTRFTSAERRPTSLVDSLGGGGSTLAFGGPAHFHGGVVVGKVTNVNDPNNAGRVKVTFAGLGETLQSDWARIVASGGGSKRGGVWIPEVNDEVLIAFEGGDARQPVVIGGLYGKNVMPETSVTGGSPQARTFTSRLGHVVGLYDGSAPADQAIRLVLDGGNHSVKLGKDKLTATVPSGTPVEITAGSTSVKFSDSGDVTIEGMNVTIKATSQMKLQAPNISIAADAKLDMKGQAQSNLGGAMVQVQADGVTKIAGSLVQIN